MHGNLEIGKAVGEDESVLIRGRDVVGISKSNGAGRKGVEGEEEFDGVGSEGTGELGVVDLLEDVKPTVTGAEEKTQSGELERGRVGGEGDGGNVEKEAAAMSEAELIQGDDAPHILPNLRGSDLTYYYHTPTNEEKKNHYLHHHCY